MMISNSCRPRTRGRRLLVGFLKEVGLVTIYESFRDQDFYVTYSSSVLSVSRVLLE